MSEVEEITERVEISTKDISKLIAILESLSNSAWAAAQSLKMIATAGTKIEEARKLMFSPPEEINKPSEETRESFLTWLGEEDI